MKISIVIPAGNEEKDLEGLVSELAAVLEKDEETRDYELLIVYTDRRTENIPQANPRIRALRTEGGFGSAVMEGFRKAKGDIVVTFTGSNEPEDIPVFVRKIREGYDMVYGSRLAGAKMATDRSFNILVRLLFGTKQNDVACVFKAYRREALEAIEIKDIEADDFGANVEVPLKAHIMGFSSAEVPVKCRGEEKKKSEKIRKYEKRLLKLFFKGNILSLRETLGLFSGSRLKLSAALVFGILVLIGIFSVSDLSTIYVTIKNTSLFYVLIGFAALSTAYIMRTWRWSVLLRASGCTVQWDIVFKSLMFGFFLNFLLPARAGDIARGVALKAAEKIPMGVSLSTVVLERAMDMFAMALMLGTGAAFISGSSTLLTEAAFAIAFLLIIMLVVSYRYETFISRKLEKRFPFISGFMDAMKEGLHKMYRSPGALVLSTALSLPVWILEVSGVYIAAIAIGHRITFLQATVAGITSFLFQAIPITPGGIGVYELTLPGVLLLFNIPKEIGLSLTLVDHFVRVSVLLVFGIISTIHLGFASRAYFAEKKRQKDIKAD